MPERIGVYVCHCGSNIAATVDVRQVVERAAKWDSVVVARDYKYMCSAPGRELVKKDIRELNLTGVVVASCSPRMHEAMFRGVLEDAGLNGYLLEIANIREQCAWVSLPGAGATAKAVALTRAAVKKARLNQPIWEREIPVNQATLVVGGGIAGIQAALQVANAGYPVYLVEREPYIGGHMAQFDKTFITLDCATCILTPKLAGVERHPNIRLMTCSEVVQVDGYVGNFRVRVKTSPRYIHEASCTGCGACERACVLWDSIPAEFDEGLGRRGAVYVPFPQAVPLKARVDGKNCLYLTTGNCRRTCGTACQRGAIDFDQEETVSEIAVGSIIIATGFDEFDPGVEPRWGYGRYENVITGMQFERMSNASGPTLGKILLADGTEPRRVAVVHCVGSRSKKYHRHCSRVCCLSSLKFAHLVREKTGAEVFEFYTDLNIFGKQYDEFYHRVREEGVHFIRARGTEVTEIDGQLAVCAEDVELGVYREIPVDMVILNTALIPRHDAEKVSRLFGISRSSDGFFMESHMKLDPVTTFMNGIYLAGCCQSPKDIPDSVAQGAAAAAQALSVIARGKVRLSPVTARVTEELCSGCRICLRTCPFQAISFDQAAGTAEINEAVCKGCGCCSAACPAGAIDITHYGTGQLLAQIEGVCGNEGKD